MLKELFRKLGRYADESPYWSQSSIMFGDEWSPLWVAEMPQRLNAPRVVYAPVLGEERQREGQIRIKALADPDTPETCRFLIDRPILPKYSARFTSMEEAHESPLAQKLFDVGGVDEIVIHESEVSVIRDPDIDEEWKTMAQEIGQRIRAHLLSGLDSVSPGFLQRIPSEDEILERVMKVIREEINPALSHHAGHVNLERITNNTIWINMGGSCQGCAEAPFTFRHDIGEKLCRAVPKLGAIYDATDHLAGVNPYFHTRAETEGRSHEAA